MLDSSIKAAGTLGRAGIHIVGKGPDLIFFLDGSAMRLRADQRSACERERSSDEKRTRTPYDVSMAAHETPLLYLYYQPHRDYSALLLFPIPADDNEGLH